MKPPNVGHALLFARVETKRRIRVLLRSRLQAGAIAIAGVFLFVFSGAAALGAFTLADSLSGTVDAEIVRYGRLTAAALVLASTGLTGIRIVGEQGELDHEAGMLTTIPYRDGVLGLLLAELVGVAAYAALPTLCVSIALAAGSGSAALGASVLVAATTLGVLGTATGHALGYALRYAFTASSRLAKYKTPLGVAVFLAYIYVVGVSQDASFFMPLLDAVGATPLGWVGLLPFAVIGAASVTDAAIGLAVAVVAIPLLLAAAVRGAGAAWYVDEAHTDSRVERDETSVSAGPLERVVGRPSAWVARTAWTRARRAPIKLVFVIYPAFVLLTPVTQAVQTGEIPATLPAIFAVYGAWAAGAGFALNPLGDEGAMLPVTLTSGVPGRSLARGLVAAGALAGAVVVLPLAVGSALLVPFDAVQVALLVVATGALLAGASMLATGIGTLFPRFEGVRISRSRRVVTPSLVAFGVYSFALLVVAAPGLATQVPVVADALADRLGLTTSLVQALGTLLTAVLVGICGYASYRVAGANIDDYRL
ncbi:hypothetical protein [Salarchaeum sp. JOR-1]|uniref:hypothetical protein n=1 Tax=Salarchaeum sp. JOR-1 TaxID=2599399 RepID=UPI0011984FB0|nr:hypothetical protein [Salarchaeum sp. JOR-1]QDX41210.1 hypothetical protein FQU85_10000 [Salarchaeum sp. JOR-1]